MLSQRRGISQYNKFHACTSTQIGEHIGVVDSAMQEVESSNRNMVDNMHEIENVMKDITDCIGTYLCNHCFHHGNYFFAFF